MNDTQQKIAAMPPRLKQVTLLIAQGFLNKEIGAKLGLTEETVRSYSDLIYERLDCHTGWGNPRVRLANAVWNRGVDENQF